MPTNGKHGKTATAGQTFSTSIDLSEDVRTKAIAVLNQQLADSLDLYSQLKQAHWNVKGPNFYQQHQLFDVFAEHAQEWVDLIAERATALGGYATGTVRMAAGATSLPEYPTDVVQDMDHTRCVVERLANYAASTREAIDKTEEWGDASTADLFTEISREVDKDLWFAEAHLQG